jgi:hypothetical protein
MGGVELVGPVGANQQDVPHLRFCDQVLKEFERGSIQPLQIVQEQRERMLWLGERAEEAAENHLESIPRLLGRQIRDQGLLSDNGGELGNQSDHELAIGTERLEQSLAPTV